MLDVAQILLGARGAEIEVGVQPGGGPGHYHRVRAGISGWLPARRAPELPGQDLGRLIAEVAQQHARASGDPEGEVSAGVLAELQAGDPG
jgi:hypothetical protein